MTTKSFAAEIMIKYGGTRTATMPIGSMICIKNARVLEAVPYALKGSVDAVVERQGSGI